MAFEPDLRGNHLLKRGIPPTGIRSLLPPASRTFKLAYPNPGFPVNSPNSALPSCLAGILHPVDRKKFAKLAPPSELADSAELPDLALIAITVKEEMTIRKSKLTGFPSDSECSDRI